MRRGVIVILVLCATAVTGRAQQPDIGPPPGRLVEVDGRRLHFICTGSGSPAVIIEAGASAFALDFSLVQPQIARTNRVCSYDRAGHGWSAPRNVVDTPARIVADLHQALRTAGEQPPFILVGASAGGLYVRLYQLEHPQEVAGLVLIDPATEDRLFTMYQQRGVTIASLTAEQLLTTLPASGSIPIPSRPPQTGVPFDRLPPELYALRVKLDERLIASMPPTVSAEIVRESAEGQRAALARLLESRSRSDAPIRKTPLVVLTRGQDTSTGLVENHAGLARLADDSRHEVVSEAGHEVHLFAPARVVEAVQDVSAAITQRTPVRSRQR